MKMHVKLNEAGRPIGESHPRAKLTDAEVDLVIGLIEDGLSLAHVALKFGVSKSCIQHIASGRNRSQTTARVVSVEIAQAAKLRA